MGPRVYRGVGQKRLQGNKIRQNKKARQRDANFNAAGRRTMMQTILSNPETESINFNLAERLASGESHREWVRRLACPGRDPDASCEVIGERIDGTTGRMPWSWERRVFDPLGVGIDAILNDREIATTYLLLGFNAICDGDKDNALEWFDRAAYVVMTSDDYICLTALHGLNGEPRRLAFGNEDDFNRWNSLLQMATSPVSRAVAAAASGGSLSSRGVLHFDTRKLRRFAHRQNGGRK